MTFPRRHRRRAAQAAAPAFVDPLRDRLDALAILQAQCAVREIRAREPWPSLRDAELRVFSQFGDDGIIQYLVHATGAAEAAATFVEFGVSDYRESNTRFLLQNDNWSGLVLDRGAENIAAIRAQDYYWRHDLNAVHAHVTRENVADLLAREAPAGELGLLSIDIDGNDYWVWEAIDQPGARVVIVEYNSLFGTRQAVTIPYEARFDAAAAHWSSLYWGASLKALTDLADRKGYALVGCDSAGNNAYFVRRDVLNGVPSVSADEGYVRSKFRESRDESGELSFVSGDERLALIADLPVVDLASGALVRLADAV